MSKPVISQDLLYVTAEYLNINHKIKPGSGIYNAGSEP